LLPKGWGAGFYLSKEEVIAMAMERWRRFPVTEMAWAPAVEVFEKEASK